MAGKQKSRETGIQMLKRIMKVSRILAQSTHHNPANNSSAQSTTTITGNSQLSLDSAEPSHWSLAKER